MDVRGVTKTYGEGDAAVRALEGVDLSVRSGEMLFLMGPSGSGKTTLLSIMGCILRPTSGSVLIAGSEVARLSERQMPQVRREKIGFIFQGFNLFPALTVRENIELTFDLKGVRGKVARQRSEELLERVALREKANEWPANLSGGQKQRVAIARALAGEPEIVLADEPTAALDGATGRAILDLLRELAHEKGRAVVIVTHDSRAQAYADRIVTIEDGRVLGGGSG
ncbi:MAG: ABC transporter ATP-binding protein [Acidobacteria bacterium]|nr:ABC transporter ATP-binding protein [Acidobacteriota bacterium]